MKIIKKISFPLGIIIAMIAMAITPLATSCNSNRYMTYEDGMLDYNDVYINDAASDAFQLNSEIDNDDQERY